MNSQYPALYSDIHGQEEAILELEPHEGFLLTVRGVSFRSYDLDTFGIWPLDQEQEKWHSFQIDREGDLVEYTLQWTMPVQIHQGSQITQGSLHCTLERSKPTEKHRYGFVQIHVILQISDITCEVTNNDTTMGTNLLKLQKQLPQDISLNCCQFCALSQDDFYGPGLLCYRQAQEQIHVVKHLPVRSKVGHSINKLRDKAVWIQEAYISPEFEEDPLVIERARKWG